MPDENHGRKEGRVCCALQLGVQPVMVERSSVFTQWVTAHLEEAGRDEIALSSFVLR